MSDRPDASPSDVADAEDAPERACEERPSEVVEMSTNFLSVAVRTRGGCIWRWQYNFGTVPGAIHTVTPPRVMPGVSSVRSMVSEERLLAVVGTTARDLEPPVGRPMFPEISNAGQIAGGWYNMCALTTEETVQCSGQYGDRFLAVPTPVNGIRGARQIFRSIAGIMAVLGDDTVWTWDSELRPVGHPTLSGVVEVSTGAGRTCMRMRDGTVRCAGGVPLDEARPIAGVSNAIGVATVVAGGAYALRADGRLLRWGRIRLYLDARTPQDTNTPELVPELTDVVRIGGGSGDLLAVRRDGSLWSIHLPSSDGVPTLARVAGFGPP